MPDNPGYSSIPRIHDAADSRGTCRTAANGRARHGSIRANYSICVNEFYKMLNLRREIMDGRRPQPKGYYFGDGVARNLSGQPFEPLEWEAVRRHGK